jgi:hypothetical protein
MRFPVAAAAIRILMFGSAAGFIGLVNDSVQKRAAHDLDCPRSELTVTRTGHTAEMLPKPRLLAEGCGVSAEYQGKGPFSMFGDSFELISKTKQGPIAQR